MLFSIVLCSVACVLNNVLFTEAVLAPETVGFTALGATPNPAHNLTEAIKMTDDIMDKVMQQQALPSLVFGISVRGKTIHTRATGVLDIENFIPANISALYRMASVTKTFTSTFIGSLVDAGKLKFYDSVYKYLSNDIFPPKYIDGKQVDITVGHVLSHMAGLHATNITDFFNITFPANSTESLRFRRNEPLYFEPGTDYNYSNYGFQMLGAIIENITGQSYPDAMDSFIKDTLKLNGGSMIEQPTTILHQHKPRYYRKNNTMLETIPVGVFDEALLSTGVWAAGGLVSNVDDMLAYGNRILDSYKERPSSVLTNATLKEIWTRRTQNAPDFPLRPINEYGYGWMIAHVAENVNPNIQHRDFNWHSGGLIGATTFFMVYPKEDIVAVAMTNKGAALGLDILCIDAVELMYDYVPKN